MANGQSLAEACEKSGISEKNYQRWLREHDGQKPAHVKCLEEFIAADKSSNVVKMPDSFGELVGHINEGHAPRGVGFALQRKLAILSRIKNVCPDPDNKPVVSFSSEPWESGNAQDLQLDKVHEALKDEFNKMTRFYMAFIQKTGGQLAGDLISGISVNVKGDAGKHVAIAMLTYFSGYEIPQKQQVLLNVGWRALSDIIDQLGRLLAPPPGRKK